MSTRQKTVSLTAERKNRGDIMLLDYFEMFFSVYKSIVIIVFWGHEGKSKFILYINENITKLRFGFRRNSLYKT